MLGDYIIKLMQEGYGVIINTFVAECIVRIRVTKNKYVIDREYHIEDILHSSLTYDSFLSRSLKCMVEELDRTVESYDALRSEYRNEH